MHYRRAVSPGGTFFFTVVTFNRQRIFLDETAVTLLRDAFRCVMQRHPFQMDAFVLLPDHLHTLWTLPQNDSDYSTRWRLVKSHFSHHWTDKTGNLSPSRQCKGELAVWQRRYWEHLIQDEVDLTRHIEYIHYNPVKHGLVSAPVEWMHSSFHTYVRKGFYPPDWGANFDTQIEVGME